MFRLNVADGIHAITRVHVNFYLIEDDDGVTIVDAGLPRMWSLLHEALQAIGRRPDELRALVLTHGHFDHVGLAARMQREWNLDVYVHRADADLAAHPYRYKPQSNRFLYPFFHPRSLPVMGRMAVAGALRVRGVSRPIPFDGLERLPVPGAPIPLHTPGHTRGHCMLYLPHRDVILTGDALVTLDPYTGNTGPQIVASAATQDTAEAMQALDMLETHQATTLLPGHGEPWKLGTATALRHARAVGEH